MSHATITHISRVRQLMDLVVGDMNYRSLMHDWTKLDEPEKTAFDNATNLSSLPYPSPEYDEAKAALGEALQHHYANNRHHPEHWKNGIDDMSLLDITEMLCDWKAATERMKDGDFAKSMAHNKERFKIGDQLYKIMCKTAQDLGYLPLEE